MNSGILDLLKIGMILNSGAQTLRTYILISLFDLFMNSQQRWVPLIGTCCSRKSKEVLSKSVSAEITFDRHKDEKNAKTTNYLQNRMDAIIYAVSKIQTIGKLLSLSHHDYLPNDYDPVKIDDDIYFQLLLMRHAEGNVESLGFRIFCYDHDSLFLQTYVESCMTTYDRHMSNKLGTHKYYFDMMVQTKNKMQNPLPNGYIIFTKHKFETSRSFENVYFDDRDSVENHTTFFLERKDWYRSKGIPHTLGFMFHGSPGCGKTSTIKAIANVGKRHIINIHLSQIKSREQLNHLFFNDELNVWDGSKSERYTIPVNERMYVIEDIDAMGDMISNRETKKPEPRKEPSLDIFGNPIPEEENQIDLSFILNLLDGTLESEGRILAITTNFPERIDRALIRPGRIDMIVNFKKCSIKTLREMVEGFYDLKLDSDILASDQLIEKWSPAEVNQIMFRNFKNSSQALKELNDLTSEDLYGFKNL